MNDMSDSFIKLHRLIDSHWTVAQRHAKPFDLVTMKSGESEWYPASVPGYVHTALVDAGVIQNPLYRLSERGCAWVDQTDWTYRCTFDVTMDELTSRALGRHYIAFEALDTFATVTLNGQFLGTSENGFVPIRFDVSDALVAGTNELCIQLESSLKRGESAMDSYLGDGTSDRGQSHYFNFPPRSFVRKPQYMFGWDWGPSLISCGIPGKVTLQTVPVAEILEWEFDYEFIDDTRVDIAVCLTVKVYDDAVPMTLGVALYAAGDNTPDAPVPQVVGVHRVVLPVIKGQKIERWNVNGLGKQRRYLLNLRLWTYDNVGLDRIMVDHQGKSVGFRTIALLQKADSDGAGAGFTFNINGRDLFLRGANWIPDGCFPGEISAQQLRQRLTQARDAGLQMLRVWGGGQYETDMFYSLCDELGLLVWQDFPFACSTYPEDDALFVHGIRQEFTTQIRRLRHRTCLAMWCGGNENVELSEGKWSGSRAATRFYGDRIIHEILPMILAKEDPRRDYLPNTPYGDAGEGNAQNENYGTAHYWNVWHSKEQGSDGDWVNYRKSLCRFSSEFGFASPAGETAWRGVMSDSDYVVQSAVSQWHDKTRKGYDTYIGFIEKHFPPVATFDDFIFYGQANQALALQCGIEHWRSLRGRCMGTLFWQLNDCWPTHSWSIIDSAGHPKLAYFQVKRSCAPIIVSILRTGNAVEAHVINDTLRGLDGDLELSIRTFDGQLIVADRKRFMIPSDTATRGAAKLTLPGFIADSAEEVYAEARFTVATVIVAQTAILLAEPKDIRTGLNKIQTNVEGNQLVLRTERFASFVNIKQVFGQPLVTLDDNGFHIVPGEVKRVTFTGVAPDDVLSCVIVTSLER